MNFGMITLNQSIKEVALNGGALKTAKLCYMDTDSFIVHIKTEDFYWEIDNDVEKWFYISNYDENDKRPLLIGKNKTVIVLVKDEQENAMRCNNCDDLLQLSFTLKSSIFSEAYI